MAMAALALRSIPRLPKGALTRALCAGTLWGVGTAAALTALAFTDCGIVCLSDLAVTTAMSVAGGIVLIGPVAAFGRR